LGRFAEQTRVAYSDLVLERWVSVIIRSRNEAEQLAAAVKSVRRQSVPAEIVIVDNDSTDGSAEYAARVADQVVHIPSGQFTYGGALNRGSASASGYVHVALSSHCALPDDDWLKRAHDAIATDGHGAASGISVGAVVIRGQYQVRNPYEGYTNHAGAWRADLLAEVPFPEDVVACEDKIWAARVVECGSTVLLSSALRVGMAHRRKSGTRSLWSRAQREGYAMAEAGLIGGGPALADRYRDASNRVALRRLRPSGMVTVAGHLSGEREWRRASES
jgi:rhamnosyltransferase